MRNDDRPLFEKHYLDMSAEEISSRRKPAKDVRMTSLEVGTEETQIMLARHNRFLLRYTNEEIRTQHATWLLGLSGCSSNDDFTHEVLSKCMERGLEFAQVVRLGLATDSIEAARFLTNKGADWKTLTTQAGGEDYSSRALDGNTPHSALLDHHMDPRGTARMYRPKEFVLALQAATGKLEAEPIGFVQGVLESGQIEADWRMKTPALGLKDGQATWISHCIASGKLNLALLSLKHFKQMPQPALDEALLACAMFAGYPHLSKEEAKKLTMATKLLIQRGANPDASFSFGVSAFEELTGEHFHSHFNKNSSPLLATTREWAVRASLVQPLPKTMESALMPSPWPKAPEKFSCWAELALNRHSRNRSSDNDVAQEMMKRLFDLPKSPSLDKILDRVDASALMPANEWAKWTVLDALLESKLGVSAASSMDYNAVMSRVVQWGGCRQRAQADVGEVLKAMDKRMKEFWDHPRLEGVLAWLPEDDRTLAASRIEDFVGKAKEFSKLQRPSEEDKQAMALAYTAFTSFSASAEPTRITPRRTL